MKRVLAATVFLVVLTTACSIQSAQKTGSQQPDHDTPIGTILRRFATQRAAEECKVAGLSELQCDESIQSSRQHLDSVNDRIELLLKNPKTNLCDLVRWAGSCSNPVYTLGDLADCLQTVSDRGEALNSGRFTLNLDPHGCPTDK